MLPISLEHLIIHQVMAKKKELDHKQVSDRDDINRVESSKVMTYDNYIRGLNDIVDKAINEIEALQVFDNDTEDFCEVFCQGLLNNYVIPSIEDYKQKLESAINSDIELQKLEPKIKTELLAKGLKSIPKELVVDIWQLFERGIEEAFPEVYDNPRIFIDIYRLSSIRAIIDYLRKNHLGEDAIDSLEEKFHTICEENPSAFITHRIRPHLNVVLPIYKFHMVLLRIMQFIQEKRPIANNTMIEEDNSKFKSLTDWSLVFEELQKIPSMKLETLVQNTKCQDDVKRVLFNSIKEGDYDSFKKTIITHEHEVRILIERSYWNQFTRMYVQTLDDLFKASIEGMDNPFEMINRTIEIISLEKPYVDNVNDYESTPDFMKKDVKEIDLKEHSLWLLDNLLKAFNDDLQKYANPSEKKIFNKVLSLVDFKTHPELKEAYEDYKARQNAPSVTVKVTAPIISEESKGKNGENENNGVYHLPVSIQNVDIDKLVRLLTEKHELNKNHVYITVLESKGDADVATCLKHFLGNASTTPLSFRLKWNGNSKVSLKFLIRLLVNTNNEATVDDVIDKKSKSDGISKKVSKWTGSGDLWTPVYNAFDGCTSSIFSIKLGDEGSKARNLNIEQLETIAKIYFACKK